MKNTPAALEGTLELHSPDGSTRRIRLVETPYLLGRGEEGNHLPIADDRISRKCASILLENDRYYLLDRGNARGLFINGGKISKQALEHGDEITFGSEVSHRIVFQCKSAVTGPVETVVPQVGSEAGADVSGGLERLNLLLEA